MSGGYGGYGGFGNTMGGGYGGFGNNTFGGFQGAGYPGNFGGFQGAGFQQVGQVGQPTWGNTQGEVIYADAQGNVQQTQ